MPATLPDLHTLDARIAAANAFLHGARAAHDHSPNPDTIAALKKAQALVDRLLDARLAMMR